MAGALVLFFGSALIVLLVLLQSIRYRPYMRRISIGQGSEFGLQVFPLRQPMLLLPGKSCVHSMMLLQGLKISQLSVVSVQQIPV